MSQSPLLAFCKTFLLGVKMSFLITAGICDLSLWRNLIPQHKARFDLSSALLECRLHSQSAGCTQKVQTALQECSLHSKSASDDCEYVNPHFEPACAEQDPLRKPKQFVIWVMDTTTFWSYCTGFLLMRKNKNAEHTIILPCFLSFYSDDAHWDDRTNVSKQLSHGCGDGLMKLWHDKK